MDSALGAGVAGGTAPLAIKLLSSFPGSAPDLHSAPCAQALGDPSPPGQQTHLVHLWALAVHRAHPSLGPQACPASRGSHSILCWPSSQTAVSAGAAAGLVQGRARRWSPCPSWGRSWLGRELSWPTQPLTISLPRAPPSLSSGTYLPFPGPSPLGTT